MTPDDFAELVRRMRDLQRRYFRGRDAATLRECKDAERRVDAALEDMAGAKQPSLFDRED